MNEKISVSKFFTYMRDKKGVWFILAALIAGCFLMMFDNDGGTYKKGGTEDSLKKFCAEIDGVSEVSVMVTDDGEGNILGIAVICDEGDDPSVKLKLTEMLCSLYDLSFDSVCVLKGGK